VSSAGAGAWTEPGAFRIAEGIHRIPLPMRDDGLRGVNIYVLEDGDGLTLIDGGWAIPEAFDALLDGIRLVGYDSSDIKRVIVTHAHVDHYTLAVRLRQRFGVQVAVGQGERPSVEWLSGNGMRHKHQAAVLVKAGAPHLAQHLSRMDGTHDPLAEGWELPDEWLAEGEIKIGARSVRVLETPGHTQGHILLWVEDEELMFTGDQILPHITPSIGFESVPEDQPLVSFLASLGRVRSLSDARLLPAHGPADRRVHERIDELVAHHRFRLDQTRDAVARLGTATSMEVARELTWTRYERLYSELDEFNATLAVNETYCHLGYLVNDGALAVAGDEVKVFSLT